MIKILSVLLLLFSVPLSAQQFCQPIEMSVSELTIAKFQGQGSANISGEICLNPIDISQPATGTATVTYNQFSYGNTIDFHITGNFSLSYYANQVYPPPTEITLRYNGGPVNYMIEGQSYEVYYNHLTIRLDANMQHAGTTGTVTVNGNELGAVNIPYDYVRIF